MAHSGYSHLSFQGNLAEEEIVCQKCGWHWKVKDGGDDLFVCHKCFTDNSKFYNYSNIDAGAIVGAVDSVAGAVGSVAQAKASKQLSKNDTQKEIDSICGKDKSKSWNKKVKQAYFDCKKSVLQSLDTDKKLTAEQKQKQQEFQQQYLLQQNKQRKNQTYIIIGVIAVILGVAIYKKMNK